MHFYLRLNKVRRTTYRIQFSASMELILYNVSILTDFVAYLAVEHFSNGAFVGHTSLYDWRTEVGWSLFSEKLYDSGQLLQGSLLGSMKLPFLSLCVYIYLRFKL